MKLFIIPIFIIFSQIIVISLSQTSKPRGEFHFFTSSDCSGEETFFYSTSTVLTGNCGKCIQNRGIGGGSYRYECKTDSSQPPSNFVSYQKFTKNDCSADSLSEVLAGKDGVCTLMATDATFSYPQHSKIDCAKGTYETFIAADSSCQGAATSSISFSTKDTCSGGKLLQCTPKAGKSEGGIIGPSFLLLILLINVVIF